MNRRTLTASFLSQAALSALLLTPGLVSARSAPASTDQARQQAAAELGPPAMATPAPSGSIASTDLARAVAGAASRTGLSATAVRPAGPIQSTDDARALAAAHAEAALVSVASSLAR